MSLRYKELFGKELYDVMKKEFSGDFGTVLQYLALPLDVAECKMLHHAMKGIGSNVNIVWSILVGRTNEELERIKKRYFELYTKDLSKLLATELHGNMERIVFNSIQASQEVFDPQFHTMDKARDDAEQLYKQGQGKWGTDEKGLFKIIFAAPPEHLRQINTVYSDKYGYTLEKVMEKELQGNLKLAAMHYISMKLKPYEAIAELLKSACAGIGTDEFLLTCSIIRYQEVMANVMTAHIELFGKTVHDRVKSETNGKYRDVLLQVLNTAWSETG